MSHNRISVIGAGISGLVAAALLAKKGYQVDLFEKNRESGGRIRMKEVDGFRFDMGPSWYWMPDIIEEYFQLAGYSSSDFYELKRLDPSYAVFWADEEPLDIPADITKLDNWLESREPGSSRKLEQFLKEAETKYRIGMGELAQKPMQDILEYLDPKLAFKALQMDLIKSMHRHLRQYFSDPKILSLLGFPVLFLGGTDKQIPALYSLMNYADLKLGTWYPMGGLAELGKAWTRIAEESGVRFHMGEAVTNITISKNRISGISVNGDQAPFATDGLVATGDYHHIDQELLPPSFRSYSPRYWEERTLAPSAILFYIGVNRRVEGLRHHNLFFDEDLDIHSASIYDNPEWPERPLFYACCPSKTDPSVAPEGCENLFILIPVAPGLEESDGIIERYFDLVLYRLERQLGTNLRPDIIVKETFGIRDFKREYNSFRGNAYGLANTLGQTAALKPSMRHKQLRNLVFAGQMTHPGPGIPPCIISGKLAADLISQTVAQQ